MFELLYSFEFVCYMFYNRFNKYVYFDYYEFMVFIVGFGEQQEFTFLEFWILLENRVLYLNSRVRVTINMQEIDFGILLRGVVVIFLKYENITRRKKM